MPSARRWHHWRHLTLIPFCCLQLRRLASSLIGSMSYLTHQHCHSSCWPIKQSEKGCGWSCLPGISSSLYERLPWIRSALVRLLRMWWSCWICFRVMSDYFVEAMKPWSHPCSSEGHCGRSCRPPVCLSTEAELGAILVTLTSKSCFCLSPEVLLWLHISVYCFQFDGCSNQIAVGSSFETLPTKLHCLHIAGSSLEL